jgi:ribosome-binding factor A
MSHRLERINELLRAELSNLVAREMPLENGLITITYVKCGADLKNATIGISVLPENLTGTALRQLAKISGLLSKELHKKLKIKFIPKFYWKVDALERYAIEIDQAIADAKNDY